MYYRKREDIRRLKALYKKTFRSYGSGAYYDKSKKRFIRYKDSSNYYTYLKKLSNRKVRRFNKHLIKIKGNNYRRIFNLFNNWL